MHFSKDFTHIEDGCCINLDKDGDFQEKDLYGVDLKYRLKSGGLVDAKSFYLHQIEDHLNTCQGWQTTCDRC